MPMQWNEQADAKLFANVLRLHVAKLDYQALAKAMGDTVTPKAISHRISKIKEKAQVRRYDWELYSNPPTSFTPKKRGPKAKTVNDDDDVAKKRVKSEDPVIKVEENTCGNDDLMSGDPTGSGQYPWVSGWQSIADPGQQFYGLYSLEEAKVGGNYDAGYYNNGGGGCENAGVDQASVEMNCTVTQDLGGGAVV